jgi:hypothetical protein
MWYYKLRWVLLVAGNNLYLHKIAFYNFPEFMFYIFLTYRLDGVHSLSSSFFNKKLLFSK